ncbi:5'-AMP-activated protein kinase subunit gamma-1-like [Bolinopsis microptera]|uniref:5'-AMP-activated protein kinase subunit gamma-1-like n=1 Tax=Bolinopsis microptera TaxID=2820187 RepID=UPI00307A51DF
MNKDESDNEYKSNNDELSKSSALAEANSSLDEIFRRKCQAFLALVTVVFFLAWAEVLSVPRKLLHLHQIITNQKKPRKGSVLLLLGWFLPLPRFLYWLGYLVPFLILSPDDEDEEIRDYLAKRKRLKKELRLFSIPAARQQYLKHFGQFYVYDLIPFSAKFCLIDTNLTVKDTATIFKDLGIEEAPLFDSTTRTIVGVCKSKSFVKALLRCTGSFVAYDARKLERLTWKKLYARDGYITPAELKPSDDWNTTALTIKSAHRAVIYQESNSHQNNPLMLLGHQKLFQYIYYKLRTYKLINMLNMRIDSLDIGTFNDLLSVTLQTSFNEVIATFSEAAITTLPVTNSYGRFTYLLDTKMLFDVVLKCPTKVRLTVADVVRYHGLVPESQLCRVVYESDTLKDVLTKLNDANANNVVVLDSEQVVKGIITTTDMLLFLGLSVGAFKKTLQWAHIKCD